MKPRILFIFWHEYEDLWQDGLWAALEELSHDYCVVVQNLRVAPNILDLDFDFILGWGAFGSIVDRTLQSLKDKCHVPAGLCIGGTAMPPRGCEKYDVLFYETYWYRPQIQNHPNIIHAFGVNTNIYKPKKSVKKVWDYITVGAFALWKRQHLLGKKPGYKLAIGEVQKGNMQESMAIITDLLNAGVCISNMVPPRKLAYLYNLSDKAYIPCDINGGGERAVLEARACGLEVEVEKDNPKLLELVDSRLYDHIYYAQQLKKGIDSAH